SEIPMACDLGLAIFSSSPSVLTNKRRGDEPGAGVPPSRLVLSSVTLVTVLDDSRSYQSLPMMPLMEGVAPLRKVLCPMAVTVGKCSYRALVNTAPCVRRRFNPAVYSERKRVR